jgi:hypothetical protein
VIVGNIICFRIGSWKTCLIDTTFSSNTTAIIVASSAIAISTAIVVVEIESTVVKMNHRVTMIISFGRFFPFIDNRLDVELESFFSFPSFFYGYQNRACFGIL